MIPIEQMKFVTAVVPVLLDNATATAVAIDTKGFAHLRVLITIGVTDIATTAAPKLQSSATSGGSYADVENAELSAVIADDDDGNIFAIDIDLTKTNDAATTPVTIKRFIKLVFIAGDGSAGINVCANGILSRPTQGSIDGLATPSGLEEVVKA